MRYVDGPRVPAVEARRPLWRFTTRSPTHTARQTWQRVNATGAVCSWTAFPRQYSTFLQPEPWRPRPSHTLPLLTRETSSLGNCCIEPETRSIIRYHSPSHTNETLERPLPPQQARNMEVACTSVPQRSRTPSHALDRRDRLSKLIRNRHPYARPDRVRTVILHPAHPPADLRHRHAPPVVLHRGA